MFNKKLGHQVNPSITLPGTPHGSLRAIRIPPSIITNEKLQKAPHTKITIKPSKPPLMENLWYMQYVSYLYEKVQETIIKSHCISHGN